MLFKINKNEKVVVNPEALMLCNALKRLHKIPARAKDILYIIYAFDYESPFHKFPEAERIKKAKLHIFGQDPGPDFDKDPILIEAIDEYKGLQFDVRYETMKNYEQKVMMLNAELLNETLARKIGDIDAAIAKLETRIVNIQDEIYKDEEAKRVIQGGGKMSFIEKWQENQKKFKESQRIKREASGIALI